MEYRVSASFKSTERYIASRDLEVAVNAAVTLQRPLLVKGEPGTGKHWVARTIHYQGVTRAQAFAALDCTGLSPPAVAGALFGPRGLAHRVGVGTVYLKEPTRLPRDVQVHVADFLGDFAAPAEVGAADDAGGVEEHELGGVLDSVAGAQAAAVQEGEGEAAHRNG